MKQTRFVLLLALLGSLSACDAGETKPDPPTPCVCLNGGTCDGAACLCQPGTFGADCGSTCACQNNGTCDDGATGTGACTCTGGFYGADCSGVCSCQHNGVCDDGAAGTGGCTCVFGWGGADCNQACSLTWTSVPANPISTFAFGADGTPYITWNDPTVLVENGTYRMWMTAGDPRTLPITVRVYGATSTDGQTWSRDPTPQLEPGLSGAWDDGRIETPSVTRDGSGTYHLYYSGEAEGNPVGVYAIGHATSADGISWVKDVNNPIIDVVGGGETSDWGVYTAAEPAAVFNPADDTIYLYYIGFGGSAEHDGGAAILLATSSDGSSFVHHRDSNSNREPVWSLTSSYPSTSNYRGYSTPAVTLGPDGLFHLTHDVVFDPNGFEQVAIAYARSTDGVSFVEVDVDIVVRGTTSWSAVGTIAPSLVFENDRLALWFAGQGLLSAPNWWDAYESGIARVDGTCL